MEEETIVYKEREVVHQEGGIKERIEEKTEEEKILDEFEQLKTAKGVMWPVVIQDSKIEAKLN